MFSGAGGLKEARAKVVPLPGISFEIFNIILNYIYTSDSGDFMPDTVVDVFEMSNRFQVEGLRHACEGFLCGCLALDNVCHLFVLAGQFLSPHAHTFSLISLSHLILLCFLWFRHFQISLLEGGML
jgi:hypothetical protein